MERCFVIQPFDGAAFDRRYDDIIDPAIRSAGLEPYRVDRDHKAIVPIQEIEAQIRSSRLCLADITLDNPNIWFELGFAIASHKHVVLICSEHREKKFPFDVQHRSIIQYKQGSTSDFTALATSIELRIKALLEKEETLTAAEAISQLQKIEGLEQHEVVALAAIGENIDQPAGIASVHDIRRDMERYGFTKFATTMALKSLDEKGLVGISSIEDQDGYSFPGYSLTDKGWVWVHTNRQEFVLKKATRQPSWDDEIPF